MQVVNGTFVGLLLATVASALLTGSTLQWVAGRGRRDNNNHCGGGGYVNNCQYNHIVVVAAISSLVQTVTCFVNALLAPADHHVFAFSVVIGLNWIVMTHSSVALVSRKLSMMNYKDSQRAWRRLLCVNWIMLPVSTFLFAAWVCAHNFPNWRDDIWFRINVVAEPIQIAAWGLIEFCLSGSFIVILWKFKWTAVIRRGIWVLVVVGFLDILTIMLNLFLGDLESTCVKGFVYTLRIRLEVSVLCTMADFIKTKKQTSGSTFHHGATNNSTASAGRRNNVSIATLMASSRQQAQGQQQGGQQHHSQQQTTTMTTRKQSMNPADPPRDGCGPLCADETTENTTRRGGEGVAQAIVIVETQADDDDHDELLVRRTRRSWTQ